MFTTYPLLYLKFLKKRIIVDFSANSRMLFSFLTGSKVEGKKHIFS